MDGKKKKKTCYLGLFEEAQEAKLLWSKDEECVASSIDSSGCPTHPVDVLLWTDSKALIDP